MRFSFLSTLLLLVPASILPAALAQADPIKEMPVFASDSRTGELDILMTAKPKPIELTGKPLTAWVYEICRRSTAVNDHCPAGSSTLSPYGGVRLQLWPGDYLKIRLINQLPPAPPDAEHAYDSDPMSEEMLQPNPTNLHTHGMIVEPRKADKTDPTYGDFIYVLGYRGGTKPKMAHPGLVYTDKPINYDIYIPKNHPSGLFWFHPHVHGLSLNQISEGMSGLITIGSPNDYLGDRQGRYGLHNDVKVHHLLLKDIQLLKDGSVFSQEEPEFCDPDPSPNHPVRPGWCPGVVVSSDEGSTDYRGGRWIFSVSGQVFPSETITGKGEVWRIASGSGSRGYSLVVRDDDTGELLPFQVLSIDGVSIDSTGRDNSGFAAKVGDRIRQVPCAAPHGAGWKSHPICASSLKMMPSARAEIYLPSRIGSSRHATFMTQSLSTGPDGDDWPSVGLVRLTFTGTEAASMLEVRPVASEIAKDGGILGSAAKISVPGLKDALSPETAGRMPQFAAHVASLADPNCKALPPGHTRRIYFGVPTGEPDGFGLGYEELDQKGRPVPGTFKDIEAFNHLDVTVCLPLAAGNKPVTERWELVNVAAEDHNFHVHQTRFRVLPLNAPKGDASGVMDNVPVLHGGPGCDGSIASFKRGACTVAPVHVEIPFSEIGDFVYHCHILEHEDGGMMAHIRVVAHH